MGDLSYIYAIDASLSNSGVCIFGESGRIFKVFSIPTSGKLEIHERLAVIGNTLRNVSNEYPCNYLVMENGFMRFHRSTQLLYEVKGVICYVFSNCKQIFYAPTTVKKVVTGSGKSDKKVVMEKVKEIYPGVIITDEDQSDAIAVGLTYFIKEKWHGEI